MPDATHAKKALTATLGKREETAGTPRTTWMKTIKQKLKSNNLSVNEAIMA